MKNLYLLFVLLALVKPIFAQVEFAPAGAEWYHLSASGYTTEQYAYIGFTYSQYTGDTLLDGVACKKICTRLYRQETDLAPSCNAFNVLHFIFQRADSIFEYFPDPFPRTRFLFRNNYAVGDAVYQSGNYILSVQSIDTLDFNGRQVRRFRIPDGPQGDVYTYDLFGPENGLFYDPWDFVIDEGITKFRCYQDAAFSRISISNEPCDLVRRPAQPHFEVKILPNPAHDELVMNVYAIPSENLMMTIYDAAGRFILEDRVEYTWKSFPIAHLSNGVYLCVFRDGKSTFHQKFVKN